MFKSVRFGNFLMCVLEVVIVFSSFNRYSCMTGTPTLYQVIGVTICWCILSFLMRKNRIQSYANLKYGVLTIIAIDTFLYAGLCIFIHLALPSVHFNLKSLLPYIWIVVIELLLFRIYYEIFLAKLPVLNDSFLPYPKVKITKSDSSSHEKYVVTDPEVLHLWKETKDMTYPEAVSWVFTHLQDFSPSTRIYNSPNVEDIVADQTPNPRYIVQMYPFNDMRHFNTMLTCANYHLPVGGFLSICGVTSKLRREHIYGKYPRFIRSVFYFLDYVWSRVMPKLSLTRPFYMAMTRGRNRSFPRVEVLGRVARAGFEIIDDESHHGFFYLTAYKASQPISTDRPSYGPLIRLMRVGYKGNLIGVYKFRTMYAYSEYIQSYVFKQIGLQDGGKLADDYRINALGHILRPLWLDEFPMIYNLLKGQLKLVGVRPLSRHYYSLYTPEMQQLRITVKPGLIPPFYYEKQRPVTLQDVQDSERRYIEAYHRAPFRTDCRYFFGSLYNILFKHARSA